MHSGEGVVVKREVARTRWGTPNNQWVAVQALGEGCRVERTRPRLPARATDFGRAGGKRQTKPESWRSLDERALGMRDDIREPSCRVAVIGVRGEFSLASD